MGTATGDTLRSVLFPEMRETAVSLPGGVLRGHVQLGSPEPGMGLRAGTGNTAGWRHGRYGAGGNAPGNC